jgi:hypothetical protein
VGLGSFVKGLFRSKEETVSFIPGQAFAWPKGLSLCATEDVVILLPGGILADGLPIQSVLEAPANARVGFDPAADGKGFETIRVALQSNDVLTLHRSSQAILLSEDARPRIFKVSKRSGGNP